MTLKELMEREDLGHDASTIHRQLAAMVEAGLLQKTGHRKEARYWPMETVAVTWVARLGRHWRRLEWKATPPLDWGFPLASRIPDVLGRTTVLRFLEAMENRNLLSLRSALLAALQGGLSGNWPKHAREAAVQAVGSPKFDLKPTIIVYGSCARGDARPESDVDVLVIAPTVPPGLERFSHLHRTFSLPFVDWERSLRSLAAEINLGAPRPLDLTSKLCVDEEDVVDLPGGLMQTIAQDGVTVYGDPSGFFAEAWADGMGKREAEGGSRNG